MSAVRLDAFLVAGGWASGREKAKELIAAGAVTVNGKTAKKAAMPILPADAVTCDTSSLRFVGRGGYKLEKALTLCGGTVVGCTALDVGASTGGFTDCLLQAGAARVFALDVGVGQLHPALRADPRVTVLEGTDVRDPRLQKLLPAAGIDFCAVDVSFISLSAVLPPVLPFLKPGAVVTALIKPQFEAGRAAVGKHGVVRDKAAHRQVLERLCAAFSEWGLAVRQLTFSPITGGEGNIEFLAVLVYTHTDGCSPPDIRGVVETAHQTLKGKK